MKELDMKETAVLSAMIVDRVRNFGFSSYEFALNLLDGHPDGLSEEEFKKIKSQIEGMSMVIDGDIVKGKVVQEYFSDERTFELLAGKSLKMVFIPLRTQTGEKYIIEYSEAGIKLPNGEMSKLNLKWLAGSLIKEKDLKTAKGKVYQKSRYNWAISPDHHPEIKGKKSVTIKNYMRDYFRS